VDSSGNLYIADTVAQYVVMVPAVGGTYFGTSMTAKDMYEVAGTGTGGAPSANGTAATSSKLNYPYGLAVDSSGNLYIADTQANYVVMVPDTVGAATGTVAGAYFGISMRVGDMYEVVGTGNAGAPTTGGLGTASDLDSPNGVAVGSSGNLYIVDTSNERVEKLVP
jgi:hypothetical protein